MAKYLLFYVGGSQPASEEEGQQVMAEWTAWFTQLGAAVYDAGNPFGPSKTLGSNGEVSDKGKSGGTGYSVLETKDLDSALEMAKNCPHLKASGDIEIYETFEVM